MKKASEKLHPLNTDYRYWTVPKQAALEESGPVFPTLTAHKAARRPRHSGHAAAR